MGAYDFVPVVQLGKRDEVAPNSIGASNPIMNVKGMPDLDKNYAEDEQTRRYVEQEVYPILMQVRQDRMGLEATWRELNAMEMLVHDYHQGYKGRSDVYLPVYSRIKQTHVSNLSLGLFPSDEYLDVTDLDSVEQDKALGVKRYTQWDMESNAKVRTKLKPFLGSFTNLGNAVFKVDYQKKLAYTGRNNVKKMVQGFLRQPEFQKRVEREGMRVSARNLFSWYMYPTTAADLDEAQIVFEDIRVPRGFAEEMVRLKKWTNSQAVLDSPNVSEDQLNTIEQLARFQLTDPQSNSSTDKAKQLTFTEVWLMMRLPAAAYLADEDSNCEVPVRIMMAGSTPVEIRRNPFYHQKTPYLVGRQNVQAGMFYGYGPAMTVQGLQYLANDFANQTNDNGIYALNPIIKILTGQITGPLRPLAPGAAYYMTSENALTFDRPPVEQLQYGIQLLNTIVGMAQDFGGAPPVLQGTGGGGKGSRTATGMQLLQKNSMAPLQDMVEDLEQDVFVPMARMAWMNGLQYRDREVIARVAGFDPMTITPEMLDMANPEFRWLASSQAVNKQQRAQQAMQLVQAIAPLVPLLESKGYKVDLVPLIERIYGDGMGFRGFEKFIGKMSPEEMQQMQMQQMAAQQGQGGQPGQEGPPGDRVRSFTEQAQNGGGGDMQPGEGEEGMNVRAMADLLAAQEGGDNGGGYE